MSLKEFEEQLLEYSEIATIPAEMQEIPETIKQYRLKIERNKTTSIFDQHYGLDIVEENSSRPKLTKNISFFDNEDVTYVVSGRGRGGSNYYVQPEKLKQINKNDENIKQHIRKLHGIGYANKITEDSVKSHQMGKALNEKPKHYLSSASDINTISNNLKSVKWSVVENQNLSDKENKAGFVEAIEDENKTNIEIIKLDSEKCEFIDGTKDKPVTLSVFLKQTREQYKDELEEIRNKSDCNMQAFLK